MLQSARQHPAVGACHARRSLGGATLGMAAIPTIWHTPSARGTPPVEGGPLFQLRAGLLFPGQCLNQVVAIVECITPNHRHAQFQVWLLQAMAVGTPVQAQAIKRAMWARLAAARTLLHCAIGSHLNVSSCASELPQCLPAAHARCAACRRVVRRGRALLYRRCACHRHGSNH